MTQQIHGHVCALRSTNSSGGFVYSCHIKVAGNPKGTERGKKRNLINVDWTLTQWDLFRYYISEMSRRDELSTKRLTWPIVANQHDGSV